MIYLMFLIPTILISFIFFRIVVKWSENHKANNNDRPYLHKGEVLDGFSYNAFFSLILLFLFIPFINLIFSLIVFLCAIHQFNEFDTSSIAKKIFFVKPNNKGGLNK